MAERGLGDTAANPRMAERAALMTRAHKREVDKQALRENWQKQAEELGFDARALAAGAMERDAARDAVGQTRAGVPITSNRCRKTVRVGRQ